MCVRARVKSLHMLVIMWYSVAAGVLDLLMLSDS